MSFNIVEYNFGEEVTFSIEDVISGKIDGFLVKQFYTKDKIGAILQEIKIHQNIFKVADNGFFSFPFTFAQIVQHNIQFQNFKHLNKLIDTHEFIQLFSIFNNGKPLEALTLNQNISLFATFRNLTPGSGEIKVHCEKFFHKEFPEFFQPLDSIIDLGHQLSFFLTIAAPEKGGELSLFNYTWGDVKQRASDEDFLVKNNTFINLNSPSNIFRKLKFSPGDLFVFNGGEIWHRVEKIGGSKNRITFGGFVNKTKNNENFTLWS